MLGDLQRFLEAPRGLLKASVAVSLAHLAFTLAWPSAAILADSAEFNTLAQNLLSGRGYVEANGQPAIEFMPAYPALVAVIYGVVGVAPRAVLCVQSLLTGVIAALTYRLAGKLFDRRVAAVAFVLIGALPGLFSYGLVMAAELLVMTLMMAYLNLAVPPEGKPLTAPRAAAAGAALACLALAKPEFCLWGLGLGIVGKSRGGWPAAARALVAGGVACLLVLSPWFARNTVVMGRFVPFSAASGRTLWPSAHKPDFVDLDTPVFDQAYQACAAKSNGDRIEIDRCLSADAVRMIKEHPGYYAFTVGKRAVRLFVGSHTEYVQGLSVSFGQALGERRLGIVGVKATLLLLHLAFICWGCWGWPRCAAAATGCCWPTRWGPRWRCMRW